MGLNETAMKLDAQLDVVVKKIERVAFDTSNDGKTILLFKSRGEEDSKSVLSNFVRTLS
jgi:hypothetical protein